MDREQTNIQSQIRKIRRVVLSVITGAALVMVCVVLFVPVDEKISAQGVVRAEQNTHLYAPVDGVLGGVDAHEGDAVGPGDPVLHLDGTELRERLLQIEASIEKARVDLESEKASLERTSRLPLPSQFWHMQEELGIARERTLQNELEYRRAEQLLSKGLVSQQDLERARLAIDVAKAEEAKAQEKIRIVEQGLEGTILEEARSEILSALSELRSLELERDICLDAIKRLVLRSPEAGTVTYLKESRPGVGVSRGENLARITHGEARRVDIYCGESQYHRLAPGQRVLMRSNTFDPLRHGYIEGKVVKLAAEPEVEEDTTQAADGPKYRVTATIESSPKELALGSTVEARIIIRRVPVWKLLLPEI